MDPSALQRQTGGIFAGLGLLGMLILIVRSFFLPEPSIPVSQANGIYANDCCGTILLRDGTIRLGKREITYVIERDKGGAYILPKRFVGIYPGQGLQVERTKYPLKLRLDDEKHPTTISIPGSDRDYIFSR